MKQVIVLDDIRMEVEQPDLDQDGKVSKKKGKGDIEQIKRKLLTSNVTDVTHPTELGEITREMMKDNVDPTTRMSDIDMRSRLHFIEIPPILAIDTLVAMKVLSPGILAFTRQKKRLSVSLKGLGRKEMVDVTVGKREQDKATGGGFLSRMFGKKPQQEENI